MLAQQYKAMYPTLELDIEGELVKLKVIEGKQKQYCWKHTFVLFAVIFCVMILDLCGANQAHGERRRALHV